MSMYIIISASREITWEITDNIVLEKFKFEYIYYVQKIQNKIIIVDKLLGGSIKNLNIQIFVR